MQDKKQFIKDFEAIKNLSELKALSSYSLKNNLNDRQFKKMMELKNKVGL